MSGSPPIPFDLAPYVPDGALDGVSALEEGIIARLVRRAWRASPPCTLVEDDVQLAAFAGVVQAEWATARTRVLAVFDRVPPGLLVARRALERYNELAAVRAVRAAAGKASGVSRRRPNGNTSSTRVEHVLNICSTGAVSKERAHARSAPDRALAPSRSPENEISLSAPEGAVIASLGARARALGDERVTEWRRKQSLALLTDAIARWRAAGLVTFPTQKAAELAAGPWSDPARVETAIATADAFVADRKAQGRPANPIGRVINALGLSQDGARRLVEPYAALARKWDDKLVMYNAALRAQAALDARREVVSKGSVTTSGGTAS